MNTSRKAATQSYYILQVDAQGAIDERRYAYFDTDLINDATNEAIDLFRDDPELETARGIVSHGGRTLPGAFFSTCAPWLLVSELVCRLFGRFARCQSIRWIPMRVLDTKGRQLAIYWLAYGAQQHDIWDYAKSDFFWHEGKQPGTKEAAGYMRKGVLDPTLVPTNCDLFLARTVYWIVSQRLRDGIDASGVEGFRFERVL